MPIQGSPQDPDNKPSNYPVLIVKEQISTFHPTSLLKQKGSSHYTPDAPPQVVQEMIQFHETLDRSYVGLQDLSYAILKYFAGFLNAHAGRMILPDTQGSILNIPETHVVYPYDAPHYFPDIPEAWQYEDREGSHEEFVNHLGKTEFLLSYPLMYREVKLSQLDFICSHQFSEAKLHFLNRVRSELSLRISKEITLERSYQQKKIINQQQQRIVKQQRSLNSQIMNIIQLSKTLHTKFSA